MGYEGFAALIVTAFAILLVVRGWDVRLVLLAAALGIAGLSGSLDKVARIVQTFLGTFSNEKFVVPICSAMGFAYVLRHTGCERHLVLLLVKPLRSARLLLVPGVLVVSFVVNIPVISQASTVVCIGPVIVPLMRAAGYSMPTIGACLLLGVSVGGELLNPGAPELLTVADRTKVSTKEQVENYILPVIMVQFAAAGLVCWVLSVWWERQARAAKREPQLEAAPAVDASPRVNPIKALVPLVPVALLFMTGPPFNVVQVPMHWVVPWPTEQSLAAVVGVGGMSGTNPQMHSLFNTRLIGLAMLVGVLAAAAASPAKAKGCIKQFFEGAGYGFANVVSLIVVANCFGKAIEHAGLAAALGRMIAETPKMLEPLAAFVPMMFGALCGSGMASTQSLYGFFHGPAVALGVNEVSVGALVSVGSAAGRTMSPVAAVTLLCAAMTETNPFTLVRRVAVPLIVGLTVVVALRMSGVI